MMAKHVMRFLIFGTCSLLLVGCGGTIQSFVQGGGNPPSTGPSPITSTPLTSTAPMVLRITPGATNGSTGTVLGMTAAVTHSHTQLVGPHLSAQIGINATQYTK
jgi:hypothetical protein